MDVVKEYGLLLLPLVLIQLALEAYCLVDLVRRPRVTGGNKVLWGAVIVIGQLIGSVAYLVAGRKD